MFDVRVQIQTAQTRQPEEQSNTLSAEDAFCMINPKVDCTNVNWRLLASIKRQLNLPDFAILLPS